MTLFATARIWRLAMWKWGTYSLRLQASVRVWTSQTNHKQQTIDLVPSGLQGWCEESVNIIKRAEYKYREDPFGIRGILNHFIYPIHRFKKFHKKT